MPLRKASPVRDQWWTWGGVLPKVLNAIVEALPEGGASPIAPEPAITIVAISLSESPLEEAATQLGITVEELLSLSKQLVIGLNDGYVLTRTFCNESESIISVGFGDSNVSLVISIDLFSSMVTVTYL